ncbi:hypothetical protein [Streptomyces sp. NBC_00046]|uniref:hypothetical protein n=1 Tax=Streptomyces sp. NBC_00046 TaxID=2975626 RepID=UPI003254D10A
MVPDELLHEEALVGHLTTLLSAGSAVREQGGGRLGLYADHDGALLGELGGLPGRPQSLVALFLLFAQRPVDAARVVQVRPRPPHALDHHVAAGPAVLGEHGVSLAGTGEEALGAEAAVLAVALGEPGQRPGSRWRTARR